MFNFSELLVRRVHRQPPRRRSVRSWRGRPQSLLGPELSLGRSRPISRRPWPRKPPSLVPEPRPRLHQRLRLRAEVMKCIALNEEANAERLCFLQTYVDMGLCGQVFFFFLLDFFKKKIIYPTRIIIIIFILSNVSQKYLQTCGLQVGNMDVRATAPTAAWRPAVAACQGVPERGTWHLEDPCQVLPGKTLAMNSHQLYAEL